MQAKVKCCAGYTSSIHQSGEFKGKPIVGYDRTNEGPQQSQNNPKRDGNVVVQQGILKLES